MHIDPAQVAKLEEARLARAYAEVAPEHRLISAASVEAGAAVAGREHPGSWLNSIVNLGMSGPVDEAGLAGTIEWYVAAGIEPTVELCPFAHPSTPGLCTKLGFVLNPRVEPAGKVTCAFDNVMARALGRPGASSVENAPSVHEVEMRVVDPHDPATSREFIEVTIARGSLTSPPPSDNERATVRRCMDHPRSVAVAAWVDGRMVGAAQLEVWGESCTLYAAKVLPEFRRRGIQQALIGARLDEGARRGARFATISSRPGVATERNARRMGFEVVYTRVMLVRPGVGLRGVGD
ncbi:MAG: hypothetical protein IT438_02455 [Phycisphaerales bacterium]|nr:hypothetical protein [Phycisphaerales bacterium]